MTVELEQLRHLMEEQLRLSRTLKHRVAELEGARRAPLAVVGLGLRLPGGLNTPEAYWDFLNSDHTAVSPIPDDRPGLRAVHDPAGGPGKSYVDKAGFLGGIAEFDAGFFGISQREAEALDPQQRLLLETAWEAMERAGIAVRRTDRLDAGVFVGIMGAEYSQRLAVGADKSGIDPYFGTSGGLCFAAGRISYALGLAGPALSVDTACSSSLVALHLAAQALRREECRYAIVGGANLVLSADLMVSLCQSRALAPDGRTKAFSADADGYGRGEGAGVLVLMTLEQALREERTVLAVLRGTAVNSDGASSGLTVPSGPAQQQVIRAALQEAGVRPEEVGYVEAHGTGTRLGDPLEAGALQAVFGAAAGTRGVPLAIGSVKSRIGHLEAASGIASLVKLVLMLRSGRIPAARSAADGPLNPLIPWTENHLTVPDRAAAWPAALPHRVAGVSAFGLSGTNAHAVLEAYDPQRVAALLPHRSAPAAPVTGAAPAPQLLTLSAKDPSAVRQLAVTLAPRLAGLGAAELSAACHTLRTGRVAFPYRLAVVGDTGAQLAERLGAAPIHDTSAAFAQLRLHCGPPAPNVAAAADRLAGAFPLLAAGDQRTDAAPDRLARMLTLLGVMVRTGVEPGLPAGMVRLSWDDQVHPLVNGDPAQTPRLLLAALGAVFQAGADVRFDVLRRPGDRIVADLPCYPFQRRRFWVDEPDVAPVAALTGPAGAAESGDGGLSHDAVTEALMAELRAVLHAEDELDPRQSFLEIGGDSFTAMLFVKGVEQRFNTTVPLELMDMDAPLASLLGCLATDIVGAARLVTR
ncbi:beta-ketoacyl synthase N-terminal-like domain-containing protein [Dactylosporangium sp. NPDC049525]|uniref:beta-ketoacyl synthase N-terminal-like domain-containing protein n=1 Tax=Dactylosporangium sp. NPDC049525 TaxID=3154730 RepID=UPI003433F2FC